MCMLTFLPENIQPDADALLNGAEWNQDGHGFAIVTQESRGPIVRRYLDAEVAVAEFIQMRAEYSDGPALFHSRFGTSGSYGTGNVHPFRVDRRTVLAHNGVLPVRYHPAKWDSRCDTKLYAQDYLRRMDMSDPKVRNQIAHDIGGGNKFVVLSTRSNYDTSYIVNEDAGHWVGGTWYSNEDFTGNWRGRYVVGGKGASTLYKWDDEWPTQDAAQYPAILCRFCGTADVDAIADVCETCDLCQDCGYVYWDGGCQCYNPKIANMTGTPMALESGVEM